MKRKTNPPTSTLRATPPSTKRTGDDRILTVPNIFSVVRLLCVPIFVWMLFGKDNRFGAAALLGGLGATDWVDGYIARHFDQGSTLGKIIDPVADRVLLVVGVGCIIIDGSVPGWVGIAFVVREVVVSVAVLALAAAGAKRIDVQWAGKAGTMGAMIAFPLFLVAHSDASWTQFANVLAWIFVVPALAFSYFAAATYIPMARTALLDGRNGRRKRP
jgi:cardiolipin synthase (CMP-forming)